MPSASHAAPARSVGDLAKVVFPLERDAWHGYATESMWTEIESPGAYRLRNVPFYAMDLSLDDIVHAAYHGQELVFTGVAARAGHSTYRLFVQEGIASPSFRLHWRPLEVIGCSYEQTDRLLAVDVPQTAGIHDVYRLLEEGANAGVWDFQEGHCGHPLDA